MHAEESGSGNRPTLKNDTQLPVADTYTGRNGVGVTLGLSSGVGVNYRRYLTDSVALRGAGYVVYKSGVTSLYSIGLTGQYDFRRDDRFTIYALGGLGMSQAVMTTERLSFDSGFGIYPGAGVGLQLGNNNRASVAYQLEVVLTAFFNDGAFVRLLPLPQVGLTYNF
jgi:opacity protein-like surface antigen